MVLSRKQSTLYKKRPSRATITEVPTMTPNSRKRAGESMVVRTKKIKVEYQEFFDGFKKSHDSELSSVVLSMGTGDAGQLGLGEDCLERKRPTPIDGLTDIVTIRAGGMHSICLSKTGKVFTFGCNDDFALGRKTVEDEEVMVPGEVILPADCLAIDITAGDSHSAVLTADSRVFIWGCFRDGNGVIGLLKPFEKVAEPVEISTEQRIVKIASGENHFVMLTDMGEIMTLGCAEQGQLGRVREVYLVRGGKSGMEMLLTPAPMRVKHHLRFSDVWAGSFCTVAQSSDGELYGCGLNNFTQLGVAGELTILLMTKMDRFNALGESWRSFAFGMHHIVALTAESRKVYVIGRNDYGNLGVGDIVHREDVIEMAVNNGASTVASVAACSHMSFALMDDGSAWSCGCGNTYQLGHGDDEDATEPQKVIGKLVADMRLVDVSVGGQHVLFRAVSKSQPVLPVDDIVSAPETSVTENTEMLVLENKESEEIVDDVKENNKEEMASITIEENALINVEVMEH